MSLITISATTPNPPIQLAEGSTATLRGFYSQRFLDSDGVTPVLAGNGQEGFYYEWECTESGGNLVIPEIEIHTTDNGVDTQSSLFTGQLYVNGAPAQVIFGQPQAGAGWIIPASLGGSTTWGVLDVYNQGRALLFASSIYTYLTAAMTAELIRLMIASVGVATTSNLGTVEISVDAVDPSRPIALGQNDPSVGDIHGSLTANRVPAATDSKNLHDSQISDDGTDVGIQTLNYVQMGDFGFVNHATRLELNDNFGLAKLFAGGGAPSAPHNEYAGIWGQCSETGGEILIQTTGQTNLYGNSDGHQTFIGDGQFDNNGTTVRVYDDDQMVSQAARNAAPADGNIFAEEICWFLEQGNSKLKARIRLDDGTYATWEGVYTPD